MSVVSANQMNSMACSRRIALLFGSNDSFVTALSYVYFLSFARQKKKWLTINANWLYAKLIVSCRPSSPPAPSRLFSRCFHHTQTSIRRKFWLKLSVFSNSRRQCLEACKRLVRRIFIMNCVAGQLSQYSVAKPSKKTRRFIVAEQTSALLRTIKIAIFGRRTK